MPEPVIDALRQAFPGAAFEAGTATDMPTVIVERDRIVDVCRHLRDDPALQFALLVEVTAVDRLPAEPRFEVVYHLRSMATGERLRVKAEVADTDDGTEPSIQTVCDLWKSANWMEREVFDMFGIRFEGHPDLRRILMPEEFAAFPLRKDYPLRGRGERHNFPRLTRGET